MSTKCSGELTNGAHARFDSSIDTQLRLEIDINGKTTQIMKKTSQL